MSQRLRWAPSALLLVLVLAPWAAVLAGGFARVIAWSVLLPMGVPLVAVPVLVATLARTAWTRKLKRPMLATLACAVVGAWPALWVLGVAQPANPATIDGTAPHATVAFPLRTRAQIFWGGDERDGNYHVTTVDQRWAYDIIVPPAATRSHKLQDFGCYGVDVLAPADALVVIAHDGEPDAAPSAPPSNPSKPLGNHVALQLDGGTYLLLAHLQPGSVTVKEGARTTTGDVIGKCGNSGNTSEPHLHIHHQRQDPRHFPVGFAEGLPLFFAIDGAARMPKGGVREEGDAVVLIGDVVDPTRLR